VFAIRHGKVAAENEGVVAFSFAPVFFFFFFFCASLLFPVHVKKRSLSEKGSLRT